MPGRRLEPRNLLGRTTIVKETGMRQIGSALAHRITWRNREVGEVRQSAPSALGHTAHGQKEMPIHSNPEPCHGLHTLWQYETVLSQVREAA